MATTKPTTTATALKMSSARRVVAPRVVRASPQPGRRIAVTAAAAPSRPTGPAASNSAAGAAAAATAGAAVGAASSQASGSTPGSKASGSRFEEGQFVWTRHWWPLMPVSYLRTDRPNPITLLGIPLVIWRDGVGEWRVFLDRCPHRLVPLSEGRIEADGSLSCAYHGWRFDGSGAARSIPQSTDAAAEATACRNRRSCATAFPVRIEAGMLCVWPDESPAAATTAAATAVLLSEDVRSRAQRSDTASVRWYMRDLPYSYELLVENVTDPAHVPYTHHGFTPLMKRSSGGRMTMNQIDPTSAFPAAAATASAAAAMLPSHWVRPSGPDYEFDYLGTSGGQASISLTMPHHVIYSYNNGKSKGYQELILAPIEPGRSRIFLPLADKLPLPPILGAVIDPPLLLLGHLMSNQLFDGDSVFLHTLDWPLWQIEAEAAARQNEKGERKSERNGAPAAAATDGANHPTAATAAASSNNGGSSGFWTRLYYMPIQSDRSVMAGRKWLDEQAGGGPFRARQRLLLQGATAAAEAMPVTPGAVSGRVHGCVGA
ncbi:hypothetical protein PLESTB_000486100 [Pleodorina starrii]|uniref:Rieske domain-containing protein n=1 Tax=Pleodorina starrii TaxID=330485 RepID=A0A9W6F0N4_9CHLO|nr:hypothetical protein PLESTB_000486100 [Pleodorina starrii]GLC63646.1 hypothetical protein PLESTF_000059000 [Pleodorina starrii]